MTKHLILIFWFYGREGKEKESIQASLFNPRSLVGQNYVEPRVKVNLLDEGYAYIQKRRDFTKDPKEEVSRNQGFRAGEASYPFYFSSRGRDSSYSGLFPP